MQDQQDQSSTQFSVPQTTPATASQPGDLLEQASAAIEACVMRTQGNPNARMQEISKIRAAYIKAKFGMDMPQ
jgi:hypothetical protein